jgi:hypothetical protein
MNSNDVKWNKIKLIEKIIPSIVKYEILENRYCYMTDNNDEAIKLANRDIWILANKFYDIATEGLVDPNFSVNMYPKKWIDVIELINSISDYCHDNSILSQYDLIELCWEMYDYVNS